MNKSLLFLKKFWYLILPFIVLAIITAIKEARTEDLNGDPYIFWAVGKKFLNHEALFEVIPGTQEYLYPPVAAMLFQILALMPFPVAVGVFTFFNFVAWMLLIILAYEIVAHYFPNDKIKLAVIVAIVATLRYFWHNIIWVNVNELVALMSVSGVYFYLKKQEKIGLGLLTLAMWTKVMPILIIGIFFIKKPVHTLLTVIGFTLGLFALIVLFRGFDQAVQDHLDFWNIAFKPFLLEGRVYTYWIAFGISATLSKLLLTHPDLNGMHYNIAELSPQIVGKISLVMRLVILGTTYFYVYLTRNRTNISLLAIIMAYLTILLVAGVSWEGHHVVLLLPVMGLCHVLISENHHKMKAVLIVFSLLVGLATSDILGHNISDYLQAYSLITYFVLFLYVTSVWLGIREITFSKSA